MEHPTRIFIDTSKQVFQLHGVNAAEQVVLRRKLRRSELLPFLDGLPPISDDEEEMLEEATAPRDEERSRLGCQLRAGTDFDCIVVDIPGSQI